MLVVELSKLINKYNHNNTRHFAIVLLDTASAMFRISRTVFLVFNTMTRVLLAYSYSSRQKGPVPFLFYTV